MNDHARIRRNSNTKLHSPAMPHHDLVVLGDCNPDLLLCGDVVPRFGQAEQLLDEAVLTIGGSGAVVGDDALGRIQIEALRARWVDVGGVIMDPVVPTGLSVILSRGEDRAILTRPGAVGALRA